MNDIQTRKDIEFLIDSFYKKVVIDETIGYIFTKIVQLNWEVHIPVMYDFWETVLLDEKKYKGNPIVKHIHLNKKSTLDKNHFVQWISLWESTVNELFKGKIADEAIKRAKLMGELMQYKIKESQNDNFIQ